MGIPLRKNDRIYTYGDYRFWPDDERWELIEGVAYNMSAAPMRKHQALTGELYVAIRGFLKGKPCRAYIAPFDVLLPEFLNQPEDDIPTVVEPDIVVICNEQKLTAKGCTGAPDLAVEVLSASTARKDMTVKLSLYEKHGIREYWIVDAGNRFVYVYRLQESGTYPEDPILLEYDAVLTSVVLDGFSVSLGELFGAD